MKVSSSGVNRDFNRRKYFNHVELDYLLTKSLMLDQRLDAKLRYFFFFQNQFKFSRIRNRCRITGKSKTVFKNLGLSRMPFRLFFTKRLLPGFKRLNI